MTWNAVRSPGTGLWAAVLTVCLSLSVLSACAAQPFRVTREPTTLNLVAADSCGTLARGTASAYEAAHPWVTVTSTVLNNQLAIEALREGNVDLGFLSRGSVDEEQKQGLWMEPFARDGIAVIVHPASPISEIGLAGLHDIFRGRLQERQGVVLTVVSREAGSGTRAAFESIVLGGQDTTLNAVVVPSSEAMMDDVAKTPGAIGYVSARLLEDRVRAVPVEGVGATDDAIDAGSYPIWRDLYLASEGEPRGEARQFAQWLLRGGAGVAQDGASAP